MASQKNKQFTCAQFQALKDLKEAGAFVGTTTLDDMIAKLSGGSRDIVKLNKSMQAKWDSHQYPDSSIVYVQLTNDPRLTCLSCEALSVLVLLGTNCLQTGLVKITIDKICMLTGLRRTKAKEAIKELKACGAIAVFAKSMRHEAPIYSVDPKIINVGKRITVQHKQHMQYVDPGAQYLLNQEPKWDTIRKATTMTIQDTEYDDDGRPTTVERRVRYMDIDVRLHKSAPEPDRDSKGAGAISGTSHQTHGSIRECGKQGSRKLDGYECDGQMDINDVLAQMDEAPSIDDMDELSELDLG